MRMAVAGGTGTVGRHVVDAATAAGHEPLVLRRSAGLDLLTGAGVVDAIRGADAVIDVSATSSTSAKESVRFFGTVTRNLLDAEREAGVGHHVALSVIGAAAVGANYYAGKAARAASRPTSPGLRRNAWPSWSGAIWRPWAGPVPVLEVALPGAWGRGMRDGSLLPAPGTRLGHQTFTEWLKGVEE